MTPLVIIIYEDGNVYVDFINFKSIFSYQVFVFKLSTER